MPKTTVADRVGDAAKSAGGHAVTLGKAWGFSMSVAVLGAILLVLIHRSVYAYLLVGDQYSVDLSSLRVADRPDWAGDALLSDLHAGGALQGKVSIFDPGLTKKVSDYYLANPWVSRVIAVEKEFPNKLRVKVEMRKPLVAVESKGLFILVDRDRVRLPGVYSQVPRVSTPILKLLGVRSAAPDAGKKWNDASVDAGAGVADALLDQRIDRQLSIASIDVSRVGKGGRESEIVIWAEENVAIEWGRAESPSHPGELAVDEKILNLKGVLMSQPHLRGVARVKVQFDDPAVIVRK